MRHIHRLCAAILVAISGAAVMAAIAFPDRVDPELYLLAAGGACLAGAIFAPLFGRPARRGAWFAVLGAVLSTVLGAAFTGLAMTPLTTDPDLWLITAAPLIVVHAIATLPHVLLAWVVTMAGAHLAMRRLRTAPGVAA